MHKIAAAALTLLTVSSPAFAQPIVHGDTPGHTCRTAGTEQFVGKARTTKRGAAIKRITHAAILRWALPGHAITMDYRTDRATVWVGPDHTITKISCG